ncbi:hypothetical protein ACEPAG_1824 [Sanghuangporus baumii]
MSHNSYATWDPSGATSNASLARTAINRGSRSTADGTTTPPWPVQTVAHISGGCDVLTETVHDIWPDEAPLPTHYTEWGQDCNLATLAEWLDRTKPFFLMQAESHKAIAAAFARMVEEGLDTRDDHIDLEVLHTYALEELDPAAEAPLDWARQL